MGKNREHEQDIRAAARLRGPKLLARRALSQRPARLQNRA